MRLLVSVSDAAEAGSAIKGGADIVDAKNPHRGPLGPVDLPTLQQIGEVCGGLVPLTAALGDAGPDVSLESEVAAFASAGASLVKIGFAGMLAEEAIESALRAAVRGLARVTWPAGVIAVAYADADGAFAPRPDVVLKQALHAGVAGLLIDTADKNGPGLRALMAIGDLARIVAEARDGGLLVAIAGKLQAEDLSWLAPLDVDIVGVRGAACECGRTSVISAERVSMLRARCAAEGQPRRWSSAYLREAHA